ncbi:hypothetical protein MFMK1_000798 [Metallumcola ferriviriculae]|uniref:Uncharacterized protein n=1 Tax=Metallumcola ferriviriculae TaxID=3039180 RepID=A0AAU0ULC0_9FIRM|nr:hypothetical protein MFMK1_000798 [Desulfitibacteraceae bacterium MK1]
MRSAFDIPNIINTKNGYVLDLSPERLTSALAAEGFSLNDSTLHSDFAGRAVLSDPTSEIAMVLNDQISSVDIRPFLSMLLAKSGKRDVNTAIAAKTCDMGYYPLVANTCNSENTSFETKFKCKDGYPTGIVEWHYARDYNGKVRALDILSFSRNNVLYIIADAQNINDLKIAMEWVGWDSGQPDKHDLSAAYEIYNGQGVIWVEEHNSGWFAALSCTNMNEYQVDSVQFTPIYALDETKTTVSHSSCFVGMGTDGLGERGSVVFAIAIGRSKAEVMEKAVAGLSNWESEYTDAENMWCEYFSGLERQWFAPEAIKAKGYFSLMQILNLSVGGYLSAGIPNWPYNWVRDTAWAIHALIPIKPALAAQFLSWFEGKNMLTVNDFDIDGTGEYNYNNTDNAAVFLAAAGKYFRHTNDKQLLSGLKPQLDQLFTYLEDNFIEADRHILARHVHDYWDDYASEITTSLVKYESMVDILWIYALENLIPVYRSLGDNSRVTFGVNALSLLKQGLADYRREDGGFDYAIKQDGTLYDSVLTVPANIFAAWMLNDKSCFNWLKSRTAVATLGGLGLQLDHGVGFSQSSTGTAKKKDIWFPHVCIIAMLAAEEGDLKPLKLLANNFPFGSLPEYVQADLKNGNRLGYLSGAWSFSWSYAAYLEMMNRLFLASGGK